MISMAKKTATAKTSTLNRATASSRSDLAIYVRDLDEWPRAWMGREKDLPSGEKLVTCFRPFLEHLVSTNLSRKTIRKHVDNLWVLGGEIIRDLNETPSLRRKSIEQILFAVIDDEGGPLIHGGPAEEQQRSFDATCRKLHRFLNQPAR
jgi:hypothetical protein